MSSVHPRCSDGTSVLRPCCDGSLEPSQHGLKTLVPSLHRGWTDDIYARSLRAGRDVQTALIRTTRARNDGILFRSDLTGFNWSNVPAILVETGFMTNPTESRLLRSAAYQLKIARGLVAGTQAYLLSG